METIRKTYHIKPENHNLLKKIAFYKSILEKRDVTITEVINEQIEKLTSLSKELEMQVLNQG